MKKINDSPNHPLIFETDDGVIGQFYNSWDKLYHLAKYIPFVYPPSIYICGKRGNFSPSREDRDDLERCDVCFNLLNNYK